MAYRAFPVSVRQALGLEERGESSYRWPSLHAPSMFRSQVVPSEPRSTEHICRNGPMEALESSNKEATARFQGRTLS